MVETELALQAARRLFEDGYRLSEAYPIKKWHQLGYPEDRDFFGLVDGHLKILWTLDRMKGRKDAA